VLRQQRRWLDRRTAAPPALTVDRTAADHIVRAARQLGRRNLPETEARGLLAAYGISLPQSMLARNEDEAGAAASRLGFPVVLKISSPDILHKTDAGGIALGLRTTRSVHNAYRAIVARAAAYAPGADIWGAEVQRMAPPGTELIIGARRDPQFGQVIMFGLGGIFVEAIADVAFRVAPIGPADAADMIREIKAFKVLQGLRGRAPADLGAIAACLLRVSVLLGDFPEIEELDINPLVAWGPGEGVMALDCRVVLS
jgi:acetyltransferase